MATSGKNQHTRDVSLSGLLLNGGPKFRYLKKHWHIQQCQYQGKKFIDFKNLEEKKLPLSPYPQFIEIPANIFTKILKEGHPDGPPTYPLNPTLLRGLTPPISPHRPSIGRRPSSAQLFIHSLGQRLFLMPSSWHPNSRRNSPRPRKDNVDTWA